MNSKNSWELSREMFLSEDEIETVRDSLANRLLTANSTTRPHLITDQLIFEVLTFSGLRNTEFCHLRVSDTPACLKQQVLVIAETPRQNRTVSIHADLANFIRDYVAQIRPELVPSSISPSDINQPLVLNERGRPLDRITLYRRVVRILSAAGLEERASVQLLRHTYGYLAYKRSHGNLLFVQRQLGHAHPMVTAVYADFVTFEDSDLANLVGMANSNRNHAALPVSRPGVKHNRPTPEHPRPTPDTDAIEPKTDLAQKPIRKKGKPA